MRRPFPDPNPSVADPDDDNDLLGGKTVKARHDLTAHIFATEALETALTRKARSLLKRESGIYILHLPHQSWVKHFERPVRNLNGGLMPRGVTALEKIGGVYYRQGAEGLDIVQRGFGVMYMSQDPKALLDEAVLAAADFTIAVPPATPALLRKVIRRVTGGTARHVTPAMAQLDLSIVLSIIRPDLSAWECVQNLQRAVDRQTAPPDHTVPLLAELPLTRSVRAWADQMLVDLAAVKANALPPSALSFGMLEGPPGTGKSLIAESLAATAGWNFVPATIGGWFAQGDGALGGVAKNLRGFIDQALALEPAIAFFLMRSTPFLIAIRSAAEPVSGGPRSSPNFSPRSIASANRAGRSFCLAPAIITPASTPRWFGLGGSINAYRCWRPIALPTFWPCCAIFWART